MENKYEYPKALVDYITELECDGKEIFTTQSFDETIWYAVHSSKPDPWIIIISWSKGDDYTITNITAKAYERIKKIINEIEN